jgi:hypothetical protein
MSYLHPLSALAVALMCAPIAEDLRVVPKEGVTIERTLSMKGHRELKSVTIKAGGQERTDTESKMHVDMSWKYVVQDAYVSVADGRVKKLERTFTELAKGRVETTPDPKGGEARVRDLGETCKLEGKTAVFAWDADKKAYAVELKDGEKDGAAASALELDMDYSAFLPPAGAEVGATWEGDLAELKGALLRPGGNLPFKSQNEIKPMDARMRDAVWDATKGKLKLELRAPREEDGVQVAVIAFEGTLDTDASIRRTEGEEGPASMQAIDAQTFKGELLWNSAAGRAHAIAWKSKGSMTVMANLGKLKAKNGEDVEPEQTLVFDEEFEYAGKFAAK